MPTSGIMGAGLAKDVALITDGRFPGGSHGFIVGRVTPEAQVDRPIALVEDADQISINTNHNQISVVSPTVSWHPARVIDVAAAILGHSRSQSFPSRRTAI